MTYFLGSIIGFYIVYAIFAAIFKHKAGLIIAGALCVVAGIASAATSQNVSMFLSSIAGIVIVAIAQPLQIRKPAKKDDSTDTDKQDDE